ncbi:hypothetical protein TNCV_3398302 [Trichonephila clavipes]|nr:hypothetical protein TNCV_3398302 [Trichonephila clavipes]
MSSFLVLREGDNRNRTREAERGFCDRPIRRNEGNVLDPPLVFKRVFQQKERLEGEARPWTEKKEKALPWIEKA